MTDKSFYTCVAVVFVCGVIGIVAGGRKLDADAAKVRSERIKEEETGRTPQVIADSDGCKVYRFFDMNRWHYFTRCAGAEKTSTESTRTERHGKVVLTRSEVITTN